MNAKTFSINGQWDKVRSFVEIADIAFVIVRLIIFCGGIGWLLFSHISQETFESVRNIFSYFALYSVLIYVWLFIAPHKKRFIYGAALVFDLLYASLLVQATGGFDSSFITGFYLITALYSFYYGLLGGTVIAVVAMLLSAAGCGIESCIIQWTDFAVRSAFLFLLAIPLGMLSQKLKSDNRRIEKLNRNLEGSLDELRNVQQKLIQAEKLSALGRLTADVAHEIRNPLTSIGGFARRLDRKLPDESREKGYADILVSEVDRLERILRDVLSFSREPKADMEYQGLNKIIRDSLQGMYDICKEQSIHIHEELDTSLPPVLIDNGQVKQALNNLLSNAVDVMPEGGTLGIRTYMSRMYEVDYVTVEVSDTGPGLSDEAVNMIFEPFYTTKEIGAGTGLGLSICRKIADEHNGFIFAESKAEDGTTFKMLFPYQSRENGSRIKCWEFNKCGVENVEGAAGMRCPAYPNYGRICWAVAGTFCGKRVSGAIAQKLGDCRKCEFYQHVVVKKDL